ncbi:MAG TPA: exodeoxyribonuclease VII large subunit [Candidatus Dormibacteraeota bacterium]|nr:exodeoxyribonuclease VII large subunit [Candidatus Dormibacteraeota bacterium]
MTQPRRTFSVTDLTMMVRRAIAGVPDLEDILVEGEVSNIRMPGSGHIYFTLKDRNASVRCVVFRREAARIPFHPQNGMVVVAHGRVDVYESDGAYQLYVDRLEPAGVGALALAVQQIAARLRAEGLFDESRKRALPVLPRRVAVVTSSTGAAVRDASTVIRRRGRGAVGAVIVPTPVQGEGVGAMIANALRRAEELAGVDVILLVRGGGSLEDLWAFNDEGLARAIRSSRVPVVTGVGHETDQTIADLAADRRAPTPSAAAEMAVPDVSLLRQEVEARAVRLRQALRQELTLKRRALVASQSRLGMVSPERRLPQMRQQLDSQVMRMRHAVLQDVGAKRRRLDALRSRLARTSPQGRVPAERQALLRRRAALVSAVRVLLARERARVDGARVHLGALSPLRTLERGYSITLDVDSGAVVTSAAQIGAGSRLRTLLRHGEALSAVVSAELPAGEERGAPGTDQGGSTG